MPRSRCTNSTPSPSPYRSPVEVQDVGLDAALANVECRIRPNRDGGDPKRLHVSRPAPLVEADHPAGVDAIRRHARPLVGPEIRGRETELAAALVTAFDQTVQAMRPSERLRGRRHVTGLNARADVGGTDRPLSTPAAARHRRSRNPNAAPSSVKVPMSPLALCPNRKFSPTTTLAGVQVGDQDLVHEPAGGSLENSRLKGNAQNTSTPSCSTSSARRPLS